MCVKVAMTSLKPVISQIDPYVHSVFRHRDKEYVLERLRGGLRFRIAKPFLKQRRERVPVNHLPGGVIHHRNLAVSLDRQLCKPMPLAMPFRQLFQLIDGNMLFPGIAREIIVEPESLIHEPGIEVRLILRQCRHAEAKYDAKSHQ
jgi:hypothetical protein